MNQVTPRRRRSTIRRSTDADIKAIYNWLVTQDAQELSGTFLCNWNLTEKCHHERELLVYIDGETSEPVAYQWGGLLQPGILEVRYDMRRKGIGKKLVERRIAQAYKLDQCLLLIQCKPSTSIPFWKSMGFTLFIVDPEKQTVV
jgi:GNAT superfamily N-acetyltransferase